MESARPRWSAEDEQKCVRAITVELFSTGLIFEFRSVLLGTLTARKFKFAGNEQR